MSPAAAIEQLCEATARALEATDRRPLLAHLFSVLPKIGLDEAMVPEPLLAHLAKRIADTGAMVGGEREMVVPVGPRGHRAGPGGRAAGGG